MSGKRRGRIGAAKISANLAKRVERVERGARKASAKVARAAAKTRSAA